MRLSNIKSKPEFEACRKYIAVSEFNPVADHKRLCHCTSSLVSARAIVAPTPDPCFTRIHFIRKLRLGLLKK